MPASIAAWLPALSLIISLLVFLGLVGGYMSFRHGFSTTTVETQEKTITALQAQVETLEKRVEADTKEIARLKGVMSTVQIALRRRGLTIEIDGDVVTLVDNQARQTRTVISIEKDDLKQIDKKEDT